MVSDLINKRPTWLEGPDRSEASINRFYQWLGLENFAHIRLAVMDMWKAFANSTHRHAPQTAILYDKFHILRHLGEALDAARKAGYARVSDRKRRFIKGQKYTLLSHWHNLTMDGHHPLKELLKANRRLNTAYVLKESFSQLWDYRSEA